MPKQKWNLETCKAEALKYKQRSHFAKSAGGAYNKALKEGWLDQVCAHMEKVRNIEYSFEQIAAEAAKYCYRSEFKEKASGHYASARRRKWLDLVCSHMQVRSDSRLHCVYAIVNKRENKAYIGITRQNLYKRISNHKSKRNNTNSKLISHLQDTETLQLTDYIYTSEQVVRFAEQKFIDLYRNNGWDVLNSEKAVGTVGYSEALWTEEKLIEEASKYQSRIEFSKGSNSAYVIALTHERREEIFAALTPLRQSWDFESVKDKALRYMTRSAFKEAHPTAYLWARRNKCLDDVCEHMEFSQTSWSIGLVRKAALSCETRTEFQKRFSGAVKWAIANDVYDEFTSHMRQLIHTWTFEELAEIAKKYEYRSDFSTEHPNAYAAARNLKILDLVCSHMENGHKKAKKWTYERLQQLASRFNSRSEFKMQYPGAYTQARKTGVLDEVCAHMRRKQRSWDYESCEAEARKCSSRSQFKNSCPGAYTRARKEGWLDSICVHMDKL
jgi:hypothetical protein